MALPFLRLKGLRGGLLFIVTIPAWRFQQFLSYYKPPSIGLGTPFRAAS